MVRRILLSTTALVAMCGIASAADLTRRPPPPVFTPPPAFTWTGFYIGATVGAVSLSTKASEPYYVHNIDPLSSETNYGGGVIAGGTIGYNYQMGSIVLGLEGDWSYTGAQTSYTDSYAYIFGKSQLTDLGTARVRLGFTPWDRTLVYATGGFAWGDLKNALGIDYPDPHYSQSTSTTRSGWTIGGGIEQALTDHISVKAEALYVDLGTTHGVDKYCGCNCRTTFKNSAVVGRVGLNYKF
jgi:outer membrane immunogenic protein